MADAFACSVLISTAPTPRLWTWPIEETLKSLVRHAPMLLRETMTVAFDGADVTLKQPRLGRAAAWDQPMTSSGPPTAFWGEKCSNPANATAYEEHKVLIKELVRGIVPKVQFVEASARLCLAGSLRHAMRVAVRTPFVLVMQSDMPLTRQLEATLPPLLSMMAARKIAAVWFALGENHCHANLAPTVCIKNRANTGKASPSLEMEDWPVQAETDILEYLHLTPIRMWSDNNHIASTRFYRDVAWPTYHQHELADAAGTMNFVPRARKAGVGGIGSGAGFPEWYLFCEPFKNHSKWRTYLLGSPCDGRWVKHLDGRKALGKGHPTVRHLCEASRYRSTSRRNMSSCGLWTIDSTWVPFIDNGTFHV